MNPAWPVNHSRYADIDRNDCRPGNKQTGNNDKKKRIMTPISEGKGVKGEENKRGRIHE
jgi:hypothetical protein